MHRKELNFKSIIFKIFILYLFIYLSALFLRFNYGIESLLINIEHEYLILFNLISITLGLPLTIIFDFILIKIFGILYVLFFAPILTLLGLVQVIVFRKMNINFLKSKSVLKNIKNNKLYNKYKNIDIKPFYILIIRTLPILPFLLGSYLIAVSPNKKKIILINSLIGAYFYYFCLFIIIGKA